jgi:AraC-like DNA-binding protein
MMHGPQGPKMTQARKDELVSDIRRRLRPLKNKNIDIKKEVRRWLTMRLTAHGKRIATNAKAIAGAAKHLHGLLEETFGKPFCDVNDDFKKLIEQLDRLERCQGPRRQINFEKRLAPKIARRLVEQFHRDPPTLALLRKIAPDVYEYITDGEQAGDLERECKAALKDVEAQPRGFTLAAPIRVPPKR